MPSRLEVRLELLARVVEQLVERPATSPRATTDLHQLETSEPGQQSLALGIAERFVDCTVKNDSRVVSLEHPGSQRLFEGHATIGEDLLHRPRRVLALAELPERDTDGDRRGPGEKATLAAKRVELVQGPRHGVLGEIVEVGFGELSPEATRQRSTQTGAQLGCRGLTPLRVPERGWPISFGGRQSVHGGTLTADPPGVKHPARMRRPRT